MNSLKEQFEIHINERNRPIGPNFVFKLASLLGVLARETIPIMQKYKCKKKVYKCIKLALMTPHNSSFILFETFLQSDFVIGTISLLSTPSSGVNFIEFGPMGWFLSLIWISIFSFKLLKLSHLVGPLHFFLTFVVNTCVEGSSTSILICWCHDCF